MDQLSFASLDYAAKKKRTKRDVFLAEMVAVVPWVALEAVDRAPLSQGLVRMAGGGLFHWP